MNNTVQIDETQAYLKVQALIRWWVLRYHRTHKGDLHDYFSEGNLAFLRAIRSYDPEQRPFNVYLHTCVWRAFAEVDRHRRRRYRSVSNEGRQRFTDVPDERGHPLESMILNLPEDAKTVIELLFERTKTPATAWRRVRAFLLSIGWSAGRVSESFREIKEALS